MRYNIVRDTTRFAVGTVAKDFLSRIYACAGRSLAARWSITGREFTAAGGESPWNAVSRIQDAFLQCKKSSKSGSRRLRFTTGYLSGYELVGALSRADSPSNQHRDRYTKSTDLQRTEGRDKEMKQYQ